MATATNGSKPEFDFSAVSRRWSKRWRQVTTELFQMARLVEGTPRDDLSPEERAEVIAAQVDAVARINDLDEERDTLLAQVLVSIPRDWLTPDAPASLDWADPASLDYVLESRYEDLMRELGAARSDSKN